MNKINTLLVLILVSSSFIISEVTINITCPNSLDIENTLNCTVTIKNTVDKPLRDIITRCSLPSGFKYRERKTGKFALKWKKSQLQPQTTHNYNLSLKALKVGNFIIIAEVQTKGNRYTAKHNIEIVSPDIEVTSQASTRILCLNKKVVFTTTIHNKGNGSVYNAITESTLPTHLEYISSEPPGIFSQSTRERLATVRWKFAEIPSKQHLEIKVTTRAIASAYRSLYSVAATFRGKKFTAYSAVRIMGPSGPHLSTYDTDDPIEVGKTTMYVITTRNEGVSAITNVTLKDTIPQEMEFIKAEGPTDCVFDKTTHELHFQSVAILQPGDKLTYKIVCKAVKESLAKNIARLKYDEFDKPIIDEEGTAIYK